MKLVSTKEYLLLIDEEEHKELPKEFIPEHFGFGFLDIIVDTEGNEELVGKYLY